MIGAAPTLGGGLFAAGSGGGFSDITTNAVDSAAPPSACSIANGAPVGIAFTLYRGRKPFGVIGPGSYCIITPDGNVQCSLYGDGGSGSGGSGGGSIGSGSGNCSGDGGIGYKAAPGVPDMYCRALYCISCSSDKPSSPGDGSPSPGGGTCTHRAAPPARLRLAVPCPCGCRTRGLRSTFRWWTARTIPKSRGCGSLVRRPA